jgi:hypothetical protein
VLLISSVLATIAGPKSHTTTKNATHVPIRKPMMQSSTTVLPGGPNVWKAIGRKKTLLRPYSHHLLIFILSCRSKFLFKLVFVSHLFYVRKIDVKDTTCY